MLGQETYGTLRSIGVFPEKALVHAPGTLDWLQAASVPVTWTTAWNVLIGVEERQVGQGRGSLCRDGRGECSYVAACGRGRSHGCRHYVDC